MEGLVKVNEGIVRFIEDENLTALFNSTQGRLFHKQVDFFHPPLEQDAFNGRYQIYLSAKFPKNRQELIFLFPNHKKSTKYQTICANSYTFLSSLNKDLNEAFQNSLDETAVGGRIKFAIAYGEHLFTCKDISGTIYVAWAKCINRINVGNVANNIARSVPLLFNLNGQCKVKSVYYLRREIQHPSELELMPLCKGNPMLLYPKAPIFVCESRPMEPAKPPIKTMSEREALEMVTQETNAPETWIAREQNAFSNLSDDALLWNGLPDAMSLEQPALTLTAANAASTDYEDGQMNYEDEPEPDPFLE